MNKYFLVSILFFIGIIFSCKSNTSETKSEEVQTTTPAPTIPTITSSEYGTLENGDKVEEYLLRNGNGMVIKIITYGGIITYWSAPDRTGNYQNIVLGYDNLDQYVASNPYFGALIGRFGNRIAKGKFSLDGKAYSLATNNTPNHLHGGLKGFDKVVWSATTQKSDNDVSLILNYVSADLEEGYPGTLSSEVTYRLTNEDALEVTYKATTDKPTIVSLTQHSYFNLSGDFNEKITNHIIQIKADRYLPVDATLIPTGELAPVEGTPFDFRDPKVIGSEINNENEQLNRGKGYDHCWVLNNHGQFRNVANLFHSKTGRFLEIDTDEPGIQFYSGNFLNGSLPMVGGGTYGLRTGLCLETQHYPDSPNQQDFPSVRLDPGEEYNSRTIFKFSVR
jgi:aldose 1-epimerase